MLGPTPHAARCPPASGFAPLRASTVCGPCQSSGPATGPERVPRAAGTKLHTPGSLTQTFPLNPGGWSRGSGEGRAVPPKASVLGSRCRRHGRSQDGVAVTACCTWQQSAPPRSGDCGAQLCLGPNALPFTPTAHGPWVSGRAHAGPHSANRVGASRWASSPGRAGRPAGQRLGHGLGGRSVAQGAGGRAVEGLCPVQAGVRVMTCLCVCVRACVH